MSLLADKLFKMGSKMIGKPLKNPLGKEIIKALKATGGKYLTDLPEALGVKSGHEAGFKH